MWTCEIIQEDFSRCLEYVRIFNAAHLCPGSNVGSPHSSTI
jgi:hypothetical protein